MDKEKLISIIEAVEDEELLEFLLAMVSDVVDFYS